MTFQALSLCQSKIPNLCFSLPQQCSTTVSIETKTFFLYLIIKKRTLKLNLFFGCDVWYVYHKIINDNKKFAITWHVYTTIIFILLIYTTDRDAWLVF